MKQKLPTLPADPGGSGTRLSQAVSLLPLLQRAALVLFDVGSDVYAAWQLRKAPLYYWMFIGVLFTPNLLADLALHLRLCYLAIHQGVNCKGEPFEPLQHV